MTSTDTSDDFSYDNVAEILQFTSLSGRRGDLPGNQDPSKYEINKGETDADRAKTITILPPFGQNRSTTILLVAGSILLVIASGVVIVRKIKK